MKKIKRFFLKNTSVRQTLVKNTLWLFLGEIAGRLLKLILILYAARILGVEGWGIFSYAISIVGLFFIFSDIGLNNLVTREISKDNENQFSYVSTILFLKLVLLAIASLLLLLVGPHITKIPGIHNVLIVMALVVIFDSLREFGFALNRAFEKMEVEAFIKIFANMITVLGGLLVLFIDPSVINLGYAYVAGSFFSFIATVFLLKKNILKIIQNFSIKFIKPIIKITWPFFIFSTLGVVMTHTDIVMLGWWKTPTDLGLYGAVQRIIQFLYIIPNLIVLSVLPIFSKLEHDEENLRRVLEKTIAFVLLFAIPVMIGGIPLAQQIIAVSLGSAYIGASVVFQIFLAIIVIMFPIVIINNFIFVKNQQDKFVVYSILGAIMNISLNLLLIKPFGITGAATATAISVGTTTMLTWHGAKMRISEFKVFPYLKKIITASIVMLLTTLSGKHFGWNIFINVGVSASVFVLMLFVLKEPLLKEVKRLFL